MLDPFPVVFDSWVVLNQPWFAQSTKLVFFVVFSTHFTVFLAMFCHAGVAMGHPGGP